METGFKKRWAKIGIKLSLTAYGNDYKLEEQCLGM